ncbi:hypothetical protein QL285_088294 [Trifolium repens]|nr:hypothetical protein QL285_088294 [Trifolium repens]
MEKLAGKVDAIKVTQGVLGKMLFRWHMGIGWDRNFYGIFSISISSKMTKTDPNTKENLQKQEKASRQGPRCQKTRKSPKSEEIEHSIAA